MNHTSPNRHRKLANRSGQAVLEFMFTFLILMVLLFGLIDFGRALLMRLVMSNLSREAANLTSRGTSLSDAMTSLLNSASPLDVNAKGYVVLTEVGRDTNGIPVVVQQLTAGGQTTHSHIGDGIGAAAVIPRPDELPATNRNLFVAEVFYRFDSITPVGNLLGFNTVPMLYDAAFF